MRRAAAVRDASDVRATAAVRNQERLQQNPSPNPNPNPNPNPDPDPNQERLLQAKGEHAAELGDIQRGASQARLTFEQNAHPNPNPGPNPDETLTLTLTLTLTFTLTLALALTLTLTLTRRAPPMRTARGRRRRGGRKTNLT